MVLSRNKDVTTPNDRRVGLIFDERMCEHHAPYEKDSIECPGRIRAIWDCLNSSGLSKRCVILNAKEAEDKHLALVHTKEHIDLIKNISSINSDFKRKKIASKYESIFFSEGSSKAAYLAAGSVIEVAEKVAKGELDSAFAIVRPPGHHAEQDQPMGFCLLNNVSVATSYLLNERRDLGINKILIVDWDVHHGNGTQKMFYDDPRVLFFSVHRFDNATFFPYTYDGSYIMTGEDNGAGYNINVPWESGKCGDADYNAVWDQILIPVAKEYNPDLIIISAGFDAAIGDPMGGCLVSPYGFSILLEKLMMFAGGKIVMALEGGYNLKSIANSAHACVEVLLQGKHIAGSLEAKPFESTLRVIEEVRQILSTYWPIFTEKSQDKVISRTSPVETSTMSVTQFSDANSNSNSTQQEEEATCELTRLRITGSNPPNRCSDKDPTIGKEGILNHLDFPNFLDIQAEQLSCNETLQPLGEEVLEYEWLSHVEGDTAQGIGETPASGRGRGMATSARSTIPTGSSTGHDYGVAPLVDIAVAVTNECDVTIQPSNEHESGVDIYHTPSVHSPRSHSPSPLRTPTRNRQRSPLQSPQRRQRPRTVDNTHDFDIPLDMLTRLLEGVRRENTAWLEDVRRENAELLEGVRCKNAEFSEDVRHKNAALLVGVSRENAELLEDVCRKNEELLEDVCRKNAEFLEGVRGEIEALMEGVRGEIEALMEDVRRKIVALLEDVRHEIVAYRDNAVMLEAVIQRIKTYARILIQRAGSRVDKEKFDVRCDELVQEVGCECSTMVEQNFTRLAEFEHGTTECLSPLVEQMNTRFDAIFAEFERDMAERSSSFVKVCRDLLKKRVNTK